MEAKFYKLSCYLLGHSEDVRAVAAFNDGTIVSTSRDKSAIVWTCNSDGTGYTKKMTLEGHTNFVSSVHVINPCDEFPKGCIISGGQDKQICVYELDDNKPKYKINAHKGNVCCINAGHHRSTFLSSSWDNSAKLWNLNNPAEPLLTLTGHTAAVWSVIAASKGRMITASADKSIIIWQNNGNILKKLNAHKDVVRDLTIIDDEEFFSCANDSHVKRWNINSGQCIATYTPHTSYIYSIDYDPSSMIGITSGEDYCVKVWRNGEITDSICLPVQSVWCAKLLKNMDIVTGASDGILRIFTMDPQRYANPEELRVYEEAISAQKQMQHIDMNSLSDVTVLTRPGNKDGQIVMVKEGDKAIAYSWSASKSEWDKIGEILGQDKSKTNKQTYNGVEYDYVFSVDIEDGAPPLKLPYNIGQDPWVVAQKFIHDNNLDQMFLEQVANFIIKNSNSAPVTSVSSQYADPFTGGNRYVPGSANARSADITSVNTTQSLPNIPYIPQRNYVKLEQANISAIFDKLHELNEKVSNSADKITNDELNIVKRVITEQTDDSEKQQSVMIIRKLLKWSNESIFPILDIARLLVLKNSLNDHLCSDDLIQMLKNHIKVNALPANQMLTFRLLANMFVYSTGETLNIKYKDEILNLLMNLTSLGSKHNQIAISTYLLNLVVALNKQNDNVGQIHLLNAILQVLARFKDKESTFRILVAVGTILSTLSNERKKLIEIVRQSETALSILTTISENENDEASKKLVECSEFIIKVCGGDFNRFPN